MRYIEKHSANYAQQKSRICLFEIQINISVSSKKNIVTHIFKIISE